MISNKIGCKYCTVQRYCENMIYCEAIQYFGSFQFIHSLVDGLFSVLLPLRLIYFLVQWPRLLIFFVSQKKKNVLITLLWDNEDLNIARKHTLAPGHCFLLPFKTFFRHEAATTNHKATRKTSKDRRNEKRLKVTVGLESDLRGPP